MIIVEKMPIMNTILTSIQAVVVEGLGFQEIQGIATTKGVATT